MDTSHRKTLADFNGKRIIFKAQVAGFDWRVGNNGFLTGKSLQTIRLHNIRGKDGDLLLTKIDLDFGGGFASQNLRKGDAVQFVARVKRTRAEQAAWNSVRLGSFPDPYRYRLSNPSRVKRLQSADEGRLAA